MKILKKYPNLYQFPIFILLLTLSLTIINYLFYVNNNINSIISLLGIIIYSLILGIKKGLNSEEKAYKEGLKVGTLNTLVLCLFKIITFNFILSLKIIIYYLIIVITTILGSIIGINKKNSK